MTHAVDHKRLHLDQSFVEFPWYKIIKAACEWCYCPCCSLYISSLVGLLAEEGGVFFVWLIKLLFCLSVWQSGAPPLHSASILCLWLTDVMTDNYYKNTTLLKNQQNHCVRLCLPLLWQYVECVCLERFCIKLHIFMVFFFKGILKVLPFSLPDIFV